MPQVPDEAGVQTTGKKPDEFAQFLNVPLNIRVEVGRRNMKVRELLTLRPEFIFALPKSAGDNVEVFANGTLIAYGEVVEMEGNAGIRITDLYEPI